MQHVRSISDITSSVSDLPEDPKLTDLERTLISRRLDRAKSSLVEGDYMSALEHLGVARGYGLRFFPRNVIQGAFSDDDLSEPDIDPLELKLDPLTLHKSAAESLLLRKEAYRLALEPNLMYAQKLVRNAKDGQGYVDAMKAVHIVVNGADIAGITDKRVTELQQEFSQLLT